MTAFMLGSICQTAKLFPNKKRDPELSMDEVRYSPSSVYVPFWKSEFPSESVARSCPFSLKISVNGFLSPWQNHSPMMLLSLLMLSLVPFLWR